MDSLQSNPLYWLNATDQELEERLQDLEGLSQRIHELDQEFNQLAPALHALTLSSGERKQKIAQTISSRIISINSYLIQLTPTSTQRQLSLELTTPKNTRVMPLELPYTLRPTLLQPGITITSHYFCTTLSAKLASNPSLSTSPHEPGTSSLHLKENTLYYLHHQKPTRYDRTGKISYLQEVALAFKLL